MNDAETRAELLRLRDRHHDLEKQVWAAVGVGRELGRGLGGLRDELQEFGRRLHELELLVDGMTRAEEIAEAVTEAIRQERRQLFTIPQRVAGATLALLVAVPAIHETVAWLAANHRALSWFGL